MANKLFSDKIIFRKNLTPSPFGTDICCRYVTSKGFRHVVALNKPFILRRMQHFFYKINTEAARNTQTLGGKPIFSSEILCGIFFHMLGARFVFYVIDCAIDMTLVSYLFLFFIHFMDSQSS